MNTKEQKQYKVYRNLHNGKFSIQEKGTGLVVGHADSVVMTDCEFKVNESGRQRVLKEKRKNVHAFVLGCILNVNGFESYKNRDIKLTIKKSYRLSMNEFSWITYNPYKYSNFFCKKNEYYVESADIVLIDDTGIRAFAAKKLI